MLGRNYAGGPGGAELFDLKLVALNTAFLLLSSITFGFAMLRKQVNDKGGTLAWLAITGLFGLCFLGVELYEFRHLIHEGATPQSSAAMSAFFALVGTHGLHVTFGSIWLVVLMVQIAKHGLIRENKRRLMCFVDVLALPGRGLDRRLHLCLSHGGCCDGQAHAHAHARAHDVDHHDDGPHSTFSGYMIGFVLSIVLTAIPFWLVMARIIDNRTVAVLVLGGFAVVQILVHMVFFLHMNGKAEGGWTMLSTIFTVVFVAIAIAGTLWVMFHMNTNMMPSHEQHQQHLQHKQDARQ